MSGKPLRKTFENTLRAVALAAAFCHSAFAQTGPSTTNQLPNPELRGDSGILGGTVTGDAPTLWRTFAVGDSSASTAIIPLAQDELFLGSPAVNAVNLTVTNFGPPATSDAGFDTFPNRFTLISGVAYEATVFLRSNNSDQSSQTVDVSLPVFDQAGTFTGNFANALFQATDTWTEFRLPPISTNLIGASGELSFRLEEGASDNSILIALPRVAGPRLENRVPNPAFSGAGGIAIENVSGDVPDFWRAFGLDDGSGSVALQTVPVAENELYPGSPATTAMRMSSSVFDSSGFDHETTQVPLAPAGRLTWGEVYLRADNADGSNQEVFFAMGIFEADGTFTGSAPGTVTVTATPEWKYFAGVPYAGAEGQTTNVAFRMEDSGTENTVLIALPTLKGLSDSVFDNGFEGDDTPR